MWENVFIFQVRPEAGRRSFMDRIIDKAAWPRWEIFDFFSGISNPFYAVTFRQDVTALRNYCKERKISFYYGLIYLCCKALQDVPG